MSPTSEKAVVALPHLAYGVVRRPIICNNHRSADMALEVVVVPFNIPARGRFRSGKTVGEFPDHASSSHKLIDGVCGGSRSESLPAPATAQTINVAANIEQVGHLGYAAVEYLTESPEVSFVRRETGRAVVHRRYVLYLIHRYWYYVPYQITKGRRWNSHWYENGIQEALSSPS